MIYTPIQAEQRVFQNWIKTAELNEWKETVKSLRAIKAYNADDDASRLFLLKMANEIFDAFRQDAPAIGADKNAQDRFMNEHLQENFNEACYVAYLRSTLLKHLTEKNMKAQSDALEADFSNAKASQLNAFKAAIKHGLNARKVPFKTEAEFLKDSKFTYKPKAEKGAISRIFKPFLSLISLLKGDPKEVSKQIPALLPKMMLGMLKGLASIFMPAKEVTKHAKNLFGAVGNVVQKTGLAEAVQNLHQNPMPSSDGKDKDEMDAPVAPKNPGLFNLFDLFKKAKPAPSKPLVDEQRKENTYKIPLDCFK